MTSAIDTTDSLDPLLAKTAHGPTGILGNRKITVQVENTEVFFTYLKEINQVSDIFYDFSATVLNEQELLMLEQIISELQLALNSIDPNDLTTEDVIIPRSFYPKLFSLATSKEQKNSFLHEYSVQSTLKCNSHPNSSNEYQTFNEQKLTGEILEQRSRLSKMARSKKNTAPFFAIAPNLKTEKKQDSTKKIEINNFSLPPLPPPFYSIKEGHQLKKEDLFDQKKQNSDGQRDGHDDENEDQEKEKKRDSSKKITIKGIYTSTMSSVEPPSTSPPTKEVGDVFHCFLLLMEKILGQAQAEAHQLYHKIKERTDQVELLTKLIGKLNLIDGKVDWSKDEEMKMLVQQARAIGVEIPENKYTWSKDEKRYLLENIQMRKDTMEKMTQLERTDMQRYMQEASHCHQARSNILKLMKEIGDTIIHNLRPG